MKHKSNKTSRSALALAATLALGSVAHAGTYYWDTDGSGTAGFGTASGTWGTSAYWNTDSTGSSGGTIANTTITTADDINFGTASAGLAAGTITGPATAQGFLNMTFGSASGAIVLSGGTLNLATAGSTITVNNTSGTISGTGFSGTGALTKSGTGELVFYGASGDFGGTYVQNISGGLNITDGTVTLSSQKIRFGSVTIGNGATLKSTASWATGASNPWFNGASVGSITVNAGGTLTATASANGITEGLTLNGGTVSAPGVSSADWGAFTIGSTVTAGGATTSTISAELAVTGVQTFSVGTGSTLSISGVMHNRFGAAAGGITKADAGTMVLTGANTYTGTTTISGGTLQVGAGGSTGSLGSATIVNNANLVYSLDASSAVSLLSGANLSGSGNLSATAGVIKFNGNITQGGTLNFTQTGTATGYKGLELAAASTTLTGSSITLSGDVGKRDSNGNSLALDTSAANGTINLDISLGRENIWYIPTSFSANAGTGTINITGSGVNDTGWRSTPVTLTGAVNMTAGVNSAAGVTINSNGTSGGTVSGVFSGGMSLTKSGSGTLTLSNTNSYTGGTTVNQGTLALNGTTGQNGTIRGTLTINSGGTVQLNKQDMLGYTGGNFVTQVNIDGGTMDNVANNNNGLTTNFTLTGGTMTASTGSGKYNFSSGYGITTLASANSSTVSAGIILRGSSNNMSFNVADGAAATDLLVSGVISQENAGNGITKSGAGTMVLSNANTYSGATTVSQGTLLVNNTTGSGTGTGTVSVSSGATLGGTGTISGNTTVSGTLNAGNGGSSKETLAFGGTLGLSGATIFDIGGTGRGTGYDGIDITGALTNGGTLSLNFTNTFANGSYTFDLFSFASQSSSFSGVSVIGSYAMSLTNNSGIWSGTDGIGNSWTFTQSTGDLGFTAVPELSNILIGGLLGARVDAEKEEEEFIILNDEC